MRGDVRADQLARALDGVGGEVEIRRGARDAAAALEVGEERGHARWCEAEPCSELLYVWRHEAGGTELRGDLLGDRRLAVVERNAVRRQTHQAFGAYQDLLGSQLLDDGAE